MTIEITGSVYGSGGARDRDSVYGSGGARDRDSVYGGGAGTTSHRDDSSLHRNPSVVEVPYNDPTERRHPSVVEIPYNDPTESMTSSHHSSLQSSRYEPLRKSPHDM